MTTTTLREQLLEGVPVAERRLTIAGAETVVLEGGDGPPIVLLHGPGGNATHWARVLGPLAATHRVIAPDLPGQGASEPVEPDRVLDWLGELIERTCAEPPVLVGHAVSGAIAARFAAGHELAHLVLVDALGLRSFEPAPRFGTALHAFLTEPSERTHDELWRYCAVDLDGLRERTGDWWHAFAAYNLDRAQDTERDGRARRPDGAFRRARDPRRRAGADRGPDRADLGPARPGDAARGRRGGERPPRLAAARDRGLRRRPAGRAARGARPRAAAGARRTAGRLPAAPRRRLRRGDPALERHDRDQAGLRVPAGGHGRRGARRELRPRPRPARGRRAAAATTSRAPRTRPAG